MNTIGFMSDMERFGKLIVSARKARGWTVREAGDRLRRQGSYVSRLENAKNANPPSATEFREIMEGFGVSPIDGLIALGYLTAADVDLDAEPWDAKMPPIIREALADIDWENPAAITQALVVLNLIRDAQRSGNQPRLHDPSEVDKKR